MPLRILCLGDIVGRPGRQIVHQKLPGLVKAHNVARDVFSVGDHQVDICVP